jgi:hypothetical protein
MARVRDDQYAFDSGRATVATMAGRLVRGLSRAAIRPPEYSNRQSCQSALKAAEIRRVVECRRSWPVVTQTTGGHRDFTRLRNCGT